MNRDAIPVGPIQLKGRQLGPDELIQFNPVGGRFFPFRLTENGQTTFSVELLRDPEGAPRLVATDGTGATVVLPAEHLTHLAYGLNQVAVQLAKEARP